MTSPSELVTEAAIVAAEKARNDSPPHEDALIPVLNAAAPLIAAEAYRLAADQLDKFEEESSRDGYVVAVGTAVSYLSGKADEWEGK